MTEQRISNEPVDQSASVLCPVVQVGGYAEFGARDWEGWAEVEGSELRAAAEEWDG